MTQLEPKMRQMRLIVEATNGLQPRDAVSGRPHHACDNLGDLWNKDGTGNIGLFLDGMRACRPKLHLKRRA